MGKINDYATGTAGPTDKLLASDGGTGVTKNLLVSDIDNFANADLTFTTNRVHDTAGFDMSISTDGGAYLESFIYIDTTSVALSTSGLSQSFSADSTKSLITANGKQHVNCGSLTTRFVQSVSYSVYSANVNYTITDSDYIVDCSNTITVTLPTAVGRSGVTYVIKNSGVGTITLEGDGTETIDGALTLSIATTKCYTVVSNGTNWIIINTF